VLIVVSLFTAIPLARVWIQLWHRFTFRLSSISGAQSSAAWPLAGAHRRLCLHVSSRASSALFYQGKCYIYPFGKKKGAVEYSFCKMDNQCQRGLTNLHRFVGW
jgi:hypothetical protein